MSKDSSYIEGFANNCTAHYRHRKRNKEVEDKGFRTEGRCSNLYDVRTEADQLKTTRQALSD